MYVQAFELSQESPQDGVFLAHLGLRIVFQPRVVFVEAGAGALRGMESEIRFFEEPVRQFLEICGSRSRMGNAGHQQRQRKKREKSRHRGEWATMDSEYVALI